MAGLLSTNLCEPCSKSELVYDQLPPVQTAIVDDYTVYCGPKSVIDGDAPLTFEITGSSDDYVDVSSISLRIKVKVLKENGDVLSEKDNVGPVNLFLHSLFSQLDVTLGDTLISQSTNTYAYRSYMTTLLSYAKDAKEGWLSLSGWHTDEAQKFDDPTNAGLKARSKWIQNGVEYEMKGRLHMDLGLQERLVPNGVDIRITLTRNKPSFSFMGFDEGQGNYKINITHAQLEVRKVKLAPKEQLRIENTISKLGARLPIVHTVSKAFSIAQGISTYDLDSLFTGQLPARIVLALVENDAFNGTLKKNAFNFKNFDLSFMVLNVMGKQIPSKPLQPNFGAGHYIDAYETLYTGLSAYGENYDHGIKREDYPNGFCIYAFNLTPDQSSGMSHVNPRRVGTVRATLHFAQALPCTVTLIAYAQFDNVITIDRFRNVIFDYAT